MSEPDRSCTANMTELVRRQPSAEYWKFESRMVVLCVVELNPLSIQFRSDLSRQAASLQSSTILDPDILEPRLVHKHLILRILIATTSTSRIAIPPSHHCLYLLSITVVLPLLFFSTDLYNSNPINHYFDFVVH